MMMTTKMEEMEVVCCGHFLVVFCQQTTKKQSLVNEKLLFLHSNWFECKATLVHTRGCLLHSFFGCFAPTNKKNNLSLMRDCFFYV